MNILVTGGAGFIGSHYVDLLIERSYSVWVVDKMTYAATAKNINSRVSGFQPWDMGNELVADLIAYHGITQVVNFAAESHVDRSVKDPEAFLRTDILGVFNLVRSCRRARVERFVHVSTDEVYGPVPTDEPYGAHEVWPLRPTSPYSASKAATDLILLAYHRTYGFPVVVVRPCNQYGPRQYPEKLIPMAITRTLRGQSVLVHGEGSEVREWMFVGDCCKIIDRVRRHGDTGEVYNVGSGDRRSNMNVINELRRLIDVRVEHVLNRPGNDARYALNCERLKEDIMNYPFTEFAKGLEETLAWYRENPGWWEGAVDWGSNIYHDNKDYLR